jgi:glutamyl-tRNA reductase
MSHSHGTMNTREFFFIGLTHRTVPLGLRERFYLSSEAEEAFARDLAALSGLDEFALLNTCNRTEIYGIAAEAKTVQSVGRLFCARQKLSMEDFEALRLDLRGEQAIEHLFSVAAGLDSQMLGETEIFGQVKKAYARAQERHAAGPVLNRIFQKTFQAAKQVRTHTAITSGLVSVANVTVDLAQKIFGHFEGAQILLLGAGEIGTKSGRAFRSRGVASLTVTSRRFERATEAAADLGGQAIPFEHSVTRLAEFDVVVCSTSAPGTVVSVEAVREAMKSRAGRPLFFIDLAMPRDVDAAVAEIDNVFVYNLDDLAKIADENRSAREAEIVKCRAILAGRADSLWQTVEKQLAPDGKREEVRPVFAPNVGLRLAM